MSSVIDGVLALIVDVALPGQLVFVSDDYVSSMKRDLAREYEISCS